MHSSDVDSRTRAFYDWEVLGRGWISYDYPVALRPVFQPYLRASAAIGKVDDGKRPTFLSRISDSVRHRAATKRPSADEVLSHRTALPEEQSPVPYVEFAFLAPEDFKADSARSLSWIRTLASFDNPASLSVVRNNGEITLTVGVSDREIRKLVEQTAAHLPEIRLQRVHQTLAETWEVAAANFAGAMEFGLAREFMLPLPEDSLAIGWLPPLIGALARLSARDFGLVQVLFHRAGSEWNREAWKAVHTENGEPFFADAQFLTDLAREKCEEPLCAAALRICIGASSETVLEDVFVDLVNTINSIGGIGRNEFTPVPSSDIDLLIHDIVRYATRRPGCLLSLPEIGMLVALPNPSIVSPLFRRTASRTKAAPAAFRDRPFAIGVNDHEGERHPVGLSNVERLKHCYLIGASGTGKSTLLLNMIEQDLVANRGIAVLDPHGDLIGEIVARVPESRLQDVILFDPSDGEFPVGFNVLQANSELERTVLSSDLVAVFKRFATSFGDQMETVLANAILAFLERPEGGTLLDLRQFLLDKPFRDSCLKSVRDREVIDYWRREFPLLRGNPQASILTRLNGFLRPRTIRNMVAQKDSGIEMRSIMDDGKILLAKLSQGLIGEENSYILGSLLVTQISQAAASRQNTAADERREFFLYLDEFHHFITPSIATILSGARKFGLGLTLAHQDLRQIKSRDDNLLSAVLGNAFTRIVFRVGEEDAKTLSAGLSFFEPEDLQNLGTGECIARIERPTNDFNLRTTNVSPIDPIVAEHRRDAIISSSRSEFATARQVVEESIDAGRAGSARDQATGEALPTESRRQGQRSKRRTTETQGSGTPGRGGLQHKYLQSLVAKLGTARGFAPSIEQRVLDGHGHVDVALVREDISIAFEISVTTSIEHEVGNLTKCIAAGFDFVVLLCQDVEQLAVARAFYSPTTDPKVRFLLPDQLVEFLDGLKSGELRTDPTSARSARTSGSAKTKGQSTTSTTDTATPEAVSGKKRLMISRDAATYIGLAPQTLAKLRVVGGSPPFYKVGRQVMYDMAELDAWLSDRRKRSTSN